MSELAFQLNILECHDQRAAVDETELLIKLLHSTHQNAALFRHRPG